MRAGRRRITTLRKLPTIRPSTPATAIQKARGKPSAIAGFNAFAPPATECCAHVPLLRATFHRRHSGAARVVGGQNPESVFLHRERESWIPGSVRDEAANGPGMTKWMETQIRWR